MGLMIASRPMLAKRNDAVSAIGISRTPSRTDEILLNANV